MSIKDAIEKYKKTLGESKTQFQKQRNTITAMEPQLVRNRYHGFLSTVENKKNETKVAIKKTKKEIDSLEDCIKLLNEILHEIDIIVKFTNQRNVGTLEGRYRNLIEAHLSDVTAPLHEQLTEIDKEILKQHYDESAAIEKLKEKNGGKRYNKRNTKSNNKNTKSNKRITKKFQ
jgi:hypothetical protein